MLRVLAWGRTVSGHPGLGARVLGAREGGKQPGRRGWLKAALERCLRNSGTSRRVTTEAYEAHKHGATPGAARRETGPELAQSDIRKRPDAIQDCTPGPDSAWGERSRLTLTGSEHGSTMAAVVDIGHPKFRCIRCDSTMSLANSECLPATIANRGDTWLTNMAMPAKS